MEFTTPPSYDSTKVAVGGIAEGSDIENGKITIAGSEVEMKHTATRKDPETGFPEPKSMQVEWKGKTKEGKEVSVVLAQDLGERYDRIDIMAQIPDMIKSIIGRIAYTKPFVYQVRILPLISIITDHADWMSVFLVHSQGRVEATHRR